MMIAKAILMLAAVYTGLGAVFALAFALRGAQALDSGARGSPWLFRLLILPGSGALWLVLLVKWVRIRARPPMEPPA